MSETTDDAITIWETNGGTYVVVRADAAWAPVFGVSDLDICVDAKAGWHSGEWEPNENDGWERVEGAWSDIIAAEAETAAPGDRTRQIR